MFGLHTFVFPVFGSGQAEREGPGLVPRHVFLQSQVAPGMWLVLGKCVVM